MDRENLRYRRRCISWTSREDLSDKGTVKTGYPLKRLSTTNATTRTRMGESFTWQVNDQLACCCWHSRIQWPSRIATASYSGSGEFLALDVSSIVVRAVHDIRTGGLTSTQDYDLYNDHEV